MFKTYFIIFLLFLNSPSVFSQMHTETESFEFEGYDRSYQIYIPDTYSPNLSYPLVFVLHGGGGTAKGLIRTTKARFNQLAKQDNFIAIYPNGIEKSWNDGARDTIGVARKLNINDVGFIERLIEKLNSKLSIDTKKIFACGISNGGFMAQRLAYELPDKIKGIGVVAANLSKVQAEKEAPKISTSVIFINGTDDPLVPYNGGQVTVFRKNRGEILSVVKSIQHWKEINHCTQKLNEFSFPNKNEKDKSTAIKNTWINQKKPNIKVAAITVINGGHTWPGTKQNLPEWLVGNTNQDFNGCDEIWNFFKSIQ